MVLWVITQRVNSFYCLHDISYYGEIMMNYYEHSKIIRVFKFYDRIVQKRVSGTQFFLFFLFTVDSLLLSDLGNNGESFYLIVNLGVGRCLVLFWFFFYTFSLYNIDFRVNVFWITSSWRKLQNDCTIGRITCTCIYYYTWHICISNQALA